MIIRALTHLVAQPVQKPHLLPFQKEDTTFIGNE